MAFQDMSAEDASTALPMIACSLGGSALYLVLLKRISNSSALWCQLFSMQTLETSGKPSALSDDVLLNSAASSRPRSMAATISPPGMAFTAAPMPVKMSIDSPTVRNLRPLKSAVFVTGFLYQPSGCVGIGPYRNDTTSRFRPW